MLEEDEVAAVGALIPGRPSMPSAASLADLPSFDRPDRPPRPAPNQRGHQESLGEHAPCDILSPSDILRPDASPAKWRADRIECGVAMNPMKDATTFPGAPKVIQTFVRLSRVEVREEITLSLQEPW